MYSLHIDYPDLAEEERIATITTTNEVATVQPIFSKEELLEMQTLVREIPVSPHVVRYAVTLARSTRPASASATPKVRQYVEWGAGPRAAQYLVLGAKALAVMQGKPTPTGADVRELARLVLRHRVMVNYAAVADGVRSADLVEDVVRNVPEPDYAAAF